MTEIGNEKEATGVKMIGCKWNVLYHKFCEHCVDGLCTHPKYCNMKTMPFKTEKVEKHD